MSDVDEIIHYINSLKKGFDKDLFQSKIEELVFVVDTTGLEYDDFHTLVKVWLNLSIPIKNWMNLGSCLAPPDSVEKRTVEYALRWILANYDKRSYFSRVGFLLDWLTVAMECESIDMVALDMGYEVFYTMLTFEALTVHAMKLIYTLTKPADVTRRRVIELIDNAKRREAKKNMYMQLQVLLGLFKSYKPECVPEDVAAISIHTAFKQIKNNGLLNRFRRLQEHRNKTSKQSQHLLWVNPINSEWGRNKKLEPLVPNIEFNNKQRLSEDKEPIKNFLDFSDPVSLVQYSLQHPVSRPARVRAMLCNLTGQMMLAVSNQSLQAFLAHDLHYVLNNCFFELSSYSYSEKQDLLQRINVFQRIILQGLPVVTRFLTQYLPLWNEKDFFPEILSLAEWVSAECPQHAGHVARVLARVGLRAQPLEQCVISSCLTNMYTNLVFASTKPRQHFLDSQPPPPDNYRMVLRELAQEIADMSNKGLQVAPDDLRVLFPALWSSRRRAASELAARAAPGALPPAAALALPLVGLSAALKDNVAELMILYKQIMSSDRTRNQKYIDTLSQYTTDMLNCLYSEEALSGRQDGLIFQKLHPQLVAKLRHLMPDVDAKFSIRNHLAFATYTYIQLEAIDHRDADNKMLFKSVIEQEFPYLGRFLKKALPELRYH